MAGPRRAKPLTELLVEEGLLTPEQMRRAQAETKSSGQPLKRVIVKQGLMSEEDLTSLVAAQSGLATLELSNYLIKPDVIQLVPEPLAKKHCLIPVFRIDNTLTVAIDDPLNFLAVDELRTHTNCVVKTVVASESRIRQAIDKYYGAGGTIAEVAQVIEAAEVSLDEAEAAGEATVIRLVDLLIMQAVKERASDIHIEPGEGVLRTRFRVDGLLREVNGPPPNRHAAVISRIKVLAVLDIAEKRRPQDGRLRVQMDGKDIDVRVSTVPTQFGEKVVLRLLDRSQMLLSLDQLGLNERTRTELQRLIRLPYGILLVTGPTGSGKTTTLYAALHLINSVEKNIITIEDPIEYHLRGVNQVQVNLKADVTFASALRSFLRQDPDVMMVGEIRDRETAEIAIQSALTGHLVFSTFHTNDAASALTRLIDIGIEPFLIASSVAGVLAQRLVRVICQDCRKPARVPADVADRLHVPKDATFFQGGGCAGCDQTGYRGRIGLFELHPMTDAIKELVVKKTPSHTIQEAARRAGAETLHEDGMAKARDGVTTIEEVLRVTQLA